MLYWFYDRNCIFVMMIALYGLLDMNYGFDHSHELLILAKFRNWGLEAVQHQAESCPLHDSPHIDLRFKLVKETWKRFEIVIFVDEGEVRGCYLQTTLYWQWQWKDIYCQSCTKKISQSYKYTIQLKRQQLSISTMQSQLWQWGLK